MGGALTADSEFGKGSVFTITLPFQVIEEKPVLSSAAKPLLREVLVIDDNATNCKLMQKIFEYLDTKCSICYSGEEAIKLIEQKQTRKEYFDLIITDYQMPEMNGIEFVKKIKQRQKGSESFILMLSSLEKTMLQQETEKVGINKFLSKPVKLKELNCLLSEIFYKSVIRNHSTNTPQIHQFNEQFKAIVVEDQKINMLLITKVVRKMNVDVVKAYNGKEALDVLDGYEPDVIFMDVNMPVMDGFTATRLIRVMPNKKSKTPIIALTADAMAEDKEKY